jgi:sirohydrochlorin ferrochelatase
MQPTPTDLQSVTILVAHGSRNPTAQAAHEQLAESLGAATGSDIRPAYLEMAEPSISGAIDTAVTDGATEVFVLPCFLHPGNHILVDIPELLARSRERHSGVRIDTGRHLGAMPALVDLLAEEVSHHRTQTVD